MVVIYSRAKDNYHYDPKITVLENIDNEDKGENVPIKLGWNKTAFKSRNPVTSIVKYNLKRENKEGKIIYYLPENKDAIQILINIHPDSLFGIHRGIYTTGKYEYLTHEKSVLTYWRQNANYRMRGRDSEREAKVYLGTPEPSTLGIKIKGNATRSFAQKSLKLVARKKYGAENIKVDWFSDTLEEFASIILSTSGNDWSNAVLREPFSQIVGEKMNFVTYPWRYSELYINGEYWGVHYVSPKVDDLYIKDKFGVEELFLLEDNLTFYKGDLDLFKSFAKRYNELLTKEKPTMVEISEVADVNSLLDYIIMETFAANMDWPIHNVRAYGIKNEPIQFILNDLDLAWGKAEGDVFEKLKLKDCFFSKVVNSVMKNENFRTRLTTRYKELSSGELSTTKLLAVLDGMEKEQEKLMPQQIMRWRTHYSVKEWNSEVEIIRQFIKNRHKVYSEELERFVAYYEGQ